MTRSSSLVALVFGSAFLLAGCTHEREFRVAYVGSEGSAQIGGEEGSRDSNGASPPIVASGNALLGAPGSTLNPATRTLSGQTVSGTVASVLPSTNQTLIQLTNGTTVLLNGTGGALGDVVAIDIGAGRVVGGSSSLLGVNVLGGGRSTGQLATVSVGGTSVRTGGSLVRLPTSSGTAAVTNVTTPVRSTLAPVTGILGKSLGGACC